MTFYIQLLGQEIEIIKTKKYQAPMGRNVSTTVTCEKCLPVGKHTTVTPHYLKDFYAIFQSKNKLGKN